MWLASHLVKWPATGKPVFGGFCMQSHAKANCWWSSANASKLKAGRLFFVSLSAHKQKYSQVDAPYETLLPSLFLCLLRSFCSNEKQMKSRLTVYKVSCAGLTEEISVHLDSLPNPLPQCLITWRDNARTHTSTHAHMKLSPRHRGLRIQSNNFHRGVQAAAADRDQTREGEVRRNTI